MSLFQVLNAPNLRPESIGSFDGKKLVFSEPSNFLGRVVNAIKRVFSEQAREVNRQGIDAYLHDLAKVDPSLAQAARESLSDKYADGSPLTLRAVRRLGGNELATTILNKVDQFRTSQGEAFENASITPEGSEIREAESLLRSLQLVKAHLGDSAPPGIASDLDSRIASLTAFVSRTGDEARPLADDNGLAPLPSVYSDKGILQIYNSRGGTLVSTGLGRSEIHELRDALDPQGRLKNNVSPEKADVLRDRAFHLIVATGEEQLSGFLEHASTEAVIDLADQISRGDYLELSALHDLHREEFTGHVLSGKEVSVLNRHQGDLAAGNRWVSDAPVEPKPAPLTPAGRLALLNLRPVDDAPGVSSLPTVLLGQGAGNADEAALIGDVHKEIASIKNPRNLPEGINYCVDPAKAPGPDSRWDVFHCPYIARAIDRPILVATDYGATLFTPNEPTKQISNAAEIPDRAVLLSYAKDGTWGSLTRTDGANAAAPVAPPADEQPTAPALSFSQKKEVREFLAELIFPENPKDAESPEQGERLRSVLSSRPDLIVSIVRNPEILDEAGIPGDFSTPLRELTDEINTIPGGAEILSELPPEEQAEAIKSLLSEAPKEVFDDLAARLDEEVAEVNFNELPGGEGLGKIGLEGDDPQDVSNIQRFLLDVFSGYFNAQPLNDRKTLIATYFRESQAGDSDNKQLVALLKGSGPYLQKLLQLFGDKVPDEQLKKDLATVKSDLKSIPVEVRDAFLSSLVRESGGAITKIEVIRSLGAASVGETFLVNLTKSDGQTEQAVVKLLRPGLQLRAAREKEFLQSVAQGIPGIPETLEGITRQIDAEMDLTHEAENIMKGQVYTEAGFEGVEAMKLVEGAPVLPHAIVIQKAPGMTVKRYIESLRAVADGGRIPMGWTNVHEVGEKLSNQMNALSELWFEQALYGNGFYHGDLHSGNIMFDQSSETRGGAPLLTVIDFGNAKEMSKEERTSVARMLFSLGTENSAMFVESFASVLSPVSVAKFDETKRAAFAAKVDEVMADADRSFGKKIGDILQVAAEQGLEIPATLSNFSRSQLMLETAISEINQVRSDLYTMGLDGTTNRSWKRNVESILKENVFRGVNNPDKFAFLSAMKEIPLDQLSPEQNDKAKNLLGEENYNYFARSDTREKISIPPEKRAEAIPKQIAFDGAVENVMTRHVRDTASLVGYGTFLKTLVGMKFGTSSGSASGAATATPDPAAAPATLATPAPIPENALRA